MITAYTIDPEFILLEKGEILREILNKALFTEIFIEDKDRTFTNHFRNLVKRDPKFKKLERFILKSTDKGCRGFLQQTFSANCKYGNNFIDFIDQTIKNKIQLDYIVTTSETHNELIKIFGSDKLKEFTIINENNFKYSGLYEKILIKRNTKININDLELEFKKLFRYSDNIEIYLAQFGKQIAIRDENGKKIRDKDGNIINKGKSNYLPNIERIKFEQCYNDKITYSDEIKKILGNYLKDQSSPWKLEDGKEFLYNSLSFNGGDEFLKSLMTIKYFFTVLEDEFSKSRIRFKYERRITIFVLSSGNIKANYYLNQIVQSYLYSIMNDKINIKVEIKFLPIENENTNKTRQSHLRKILTRQRVIDLNSISIFVKKYQNIKDYDSSDSYIANMEYRKDRTDFKLLKDHEMLFEDNNVSDSELDDFLKDREYFTKNAFMASKLK
tara:strand:+ start:3269 stop:4594 length:1326 start_codon:yes stop_codon:yes gene_type:complete